MREVNTVIRAANAASRGEIKNHPGGQKRIFPLSRAISNSRKSACAEARSSLPFYFHPLFRWATFIIFLSRERRGEKRQNVRLVGRFSWQRLRQLGENWIDSGVPGHAKFSSGSCRWRREKARGRKSLNERGREKENAVSFLCILHLTIKRTTTRY